MSGGVAAPSVIGVDDIIAGIKAGPGGPKVAAFFDFDGTLIAAHSIRSRYSHRARNFELDELMRTLRVAPAGPLDEDAFTDLMLQEIRGWAGRTENELMALGEQLFAQHLAGALFHGAWRLVRAHQNRGHTVVIATSATRDQAAPTARELGIGHMLCTELETRDGVLTGRLAGRPLWGAEKLSAVQNFARCKGITLNASHAYADGGEDVSLLDAVGFPHPVNPAPALARCAGERGWDVLRLPANRTQLHPVALARTAALYGSFVTAVGAGAVVGALTRDSRGGMDLTTSVFGRVGSRVGNIGFEVIGQRHTARRPAVFFVNHQSTLIDALVASRVIQRGFTLVAKAEVKQIPLLGPLLALADVAFVDRSDTSKAISAMQPAVDKLRAGVSIAMSPEGTRSFSPRIGEFKKGGFHLARDAGVPIVPIVIRNAGEIMWRHAKIAQEGTIEVVVHEPVPTAGWSRRELDEWVARMRQLYIDTLDDWPGGDAGKAWSEAIVQARANRRP
ncbi:HAD-IB family hydrolase [Mycolicibacter senuensis]|nr:HAD-IB family hydrolase [Mycolicibacter senuensis]